MHCRVFRGCLRGCVWAPHCACRFVCHSILGVQRGEGACFLTPLPAGSVLYGSGLSAVALSKVCCLCYMPVLKSSGVIVLEI